MFKPRPDFFTFQVSQAQMPTSVHLSGPFDDGVANVSLYDKINVDCIVDNARPKPLITWFVEEMELTGTNTSDSEDTDSFTQTLVYNPGNKKNICLLSGPFINDVT